MAGPSPESLTSSRPSAPGGPTLLGFQHPTTTRPELAPLRTTYHRRPGSALRVSHPPSGLLAHSSSRTCFIPLPSGLPPSELSPPRDRAPLSRPLASPRLFTEVQDAIPGALSPAVSPTPTLACDRLVPPRTMGSLFTQPEDVLPVHPGHRASGSPPHPAPSASKPCSP